MNEIVKVPPATKYRFRTGKKGWRWWWVVEQSRRYYHRWGPVAFDDTWEWVCIKDGRSFTEYRADRAALRHLADRNAEALRDERRKSQAKARAAAESKTIKVVSA